MNDDFRNTYLPSSTYLEKKSEEESSTPFQPVKLYKQNVYTIT